MSPKIVGATDDADALTKARPALNEQSASVCRRRTPQAYYLDVTSPHANKGAVVDYLARRFDIPTDAIATIGDAHNDVSMFERCGTLHRDG